MWLSYRSSETKTINIPGKQSTEKDETERMRRAGQRGKCYREAQRENPSMVYRQS